MIAASERMAAMESRQMETVIVGARALLPDGALEETDLILRDGQIAAIGAAPGPAARSWHAPGLYVLPGMVDLHGDAFERQLMPRPGVRFPDELALAETDRQLLANGITTAYHGLTYSWEPGLRDGESARRFVAKLQAMRDLIKYGLTDGQKDAEALGYIPLPAAIVAKAESAIQNLSAQ